MRFIHTADWHLGNQIHNVNRTQEYLTFFEWLKNQIIKNEVQALIISGDIFDVVNPSVEARKLYYDFLASIKDTNCSNIIIIGGNHDSGIMLNSSKELLKNFNIYVVGTLANVSVNELIVELKDKNQNIIGYCAAIPYARETELNYYIEESCQNSEKTENDLCDKGYKIIYDKVLAEIKKIRGNKKVPIIATGHLHAANLDGLRSDENSKQIEKQNLKLDDGVKNLDVIGNLGKVHSKIFSEDFDYVALGHIHYPSMVSKNPKIRYSGSPVLMGFDECKIKKGVLLVDVDSENLSVKTLEFKDSAFFWERIQGSIEEIKNRLVEYSNSEVEKENYIEICYKPEINKNIQIELEEVIKNLPPKIHIASYKIYTDFQEKLNLQQLSEIQTDFVDFDEETIFKSLILSKLKLNEDSEEGKEAVKNFLPQFLKILGEVEIENN